MENKTSIRETYPLSVVIATLGGDALAGTIENLNGGACIPAEVLICIPEAESFRAEDLSFTNVRVVRTPCRGQVAQRAYGLLRVRSPMVLQMDDDIVLLPGDLRKLVEALVQIGHGNAIAPLYRHLTTGHFITECHRGVSGWRESLFALLICGAPWGAKRMGVISAAGIGFGIDEMHCGQELVETQWLPGGCVLCYQEDLIRDDYYPFTGKAYTEDLVHSLLWRKNGVRLWALPTAYCMTTVADVPFSWPTLKAELRAHDYVVRLMKGDIWRLRLWYFVLASKQIVKNCYNWFLSKSGLK